MGYKIKHIYQGENLVRPVWKPGSNTLLYLPLQSDGNDYSGNNHNLTWSGTPTYTTSGTTKNVTLFNGSTGGLISGLGGTYTNYTINVWCKPNNDTQTTQWVFGNVKWFSGGYTYGEQVYFTYNWESQDYGRIGFSYHWRPGGGYSNKTRTIVDKDNNYPKNNWYNVIVTANPNGVDMYVNNQLIASNTSTSNSIVLTSGKNTVGYQYLDNGGTKRNYYYGYMSDFIFENKTWTAQEISDYYNGTKSLYGL